MLLLTLGDEDARRGRRALSMPGYPREGAYLTNVVKRFKFERRTCPGWQSHIDNETADCVAADTGAVGQIELGGDEPAGS